MLDGMVCLIGSEMVGKSGAGDPSGKLAPSREVSNFKVEKNGSPFDARTKNPPIFR
jgi:hypothetical protein